MIRLGNYGMLIFAIIGTIKKGAGRDDTVNMRGGAFNLFVDKYWCDVKPNTQKQ